MPLCGYDIIIVYDYYIAQVRLCRHAHDYN